jgi:hypothetical protein
MSRTFNSRMVPRSQMRRRAWIAYGASPRLIPSVVWDFSEKGARISAPHLSLLPDLFTLMLTGDGRERRLCRVVWRGTRFAGVSFLSEDEAERVNKALSRKEPHLV